MISSKLPEVGTTIFTRMSALAAQCKAINLSQGYPDFEPHPRLLQSLSAFETYSQECEDRNPEDALLHAFLHRTTAHVRRIMEEALRHLVRVEGIRVD